jgi:hypothetical protein
MYLHLFIAAAVAGGVLHMMLAAGLSEGVFQLRRAPVCRMCGRDKRHCSCAGSH